MSIYNLDSSINGMVRAVGDFVVRKCMCRHTRGKYYLNTILYFLFQAKTIKKYKQDNKIICS